MTATVREYGFELRLCAHLETAGVPGVGDASVVARQLGTSVHAAGGRIVDTVCVLPGPEFDDRVTLTPCRRPSSTRTCQSASTSA